MRIVEDGILVSKEYAQINYEVGGHFQSKLQPNPWSLHVQRPTTGAHLLPLEFGAATVAR